MGKVLIVDDDEGLRTALQLYLEDEGYEVAVAANGADALDHLRRARPDAIVMDLQMPVMDGFALLAALDADPEWAAIPRFVMSACLADPARLATQFPKPFDVEELLDAVRARQAHPAGRHLLN